MKGLLTDMHLSQMVEDNYSTEVMATLMLEANTQPNPEDAKFIRYAYRVFALLSASSGIVDEFSKLEVKDARHREKDMNPVISKGNASNFMQEMKDIIGSMKDLKGETQNWERLHELMPEKHTAGKSQTGPNRFTVGDWNDAIRELEDRSKEIGVNIANVGYYPERAVSTDETAAVDKVKNLFTHIDPGIKKWVEDFIKSQQRPDYSKLNWKDFGNVTRHFKIFVKDDTQRAFAAAAALLIAGTAATYGIKWIQDRHIRTMGKMATEKAAVLARMEGIYIAPETLKKSMKSMVRNPLLRGKLKMHLAHGDQSSMKRAADFIAQELVKQSKAISTIPATPGY